MHSHLQVDLHQLYAAFSKFAFYGVMVWTSTEITVFWKAISKFDTMLAVETESCIYAP